MTTDHATDGLRAGLAALASEMVAYDCTEAEVPAHVDVPDDYEAGVNDSGRQIRALLDRFPVETAGERETDGLSEAIRKALVEDAWEGHEEPLTDDDLDRIAEVAQAAITAALAARAGGAGVGEE